MNNKSNEIIFQFISEPKEVNFSGKVHGGSVMKWIDQAAYTCARNWAESYCVTAYIGGTSFYGPINIGEVVKVVARVIYTGRTSIHISVDVFSRDFSESEFKLRTHCVTVFVGVDGDGKPQPVKPWVPQSEKEKKMAVYAQTLKSFQDKINVEIKQYIGQ
jgi:acyl-CoA hydrolase